VSDTPCSACGIVITLGWSDHVGAPLDAITWDERFSAADSLLERPVATDRRGRIFDAFEADADRLAFDDPVHALVPCAP
jgi:hypothetical protein